MITVLIVLKYKITEFVLWNVDDLTLLIEILSLYFLCLSNAVCLWVRAYACVRVPLVRSAVFPWTNLLVVVVELEGSEQEALDLVPMVTKAVLEEHYLIVGVVVVTDIGVIPINSRGEKQRMHLRDGFLQDQLDPIYVAYNM